MAIELITGRAGAPHVDSADVGAFNAAMFGGGAYVIEACEATLTDANHVLVSAGELLCDGRHVRITGAGETLTIDNGLSGYKRNDIVAMRYERNSSDIETCSLVVIKGNQDTGAAQDPPMPTAGKLIDGASEVYWPLYRIVIDGLTPQTPNFIAQRQALYKLGQGMEIPANSDLNDYIRPGKYWIDYANVSTIAHIPTNISTSCIMYVDTVKEGYLQQRYVLGVASQGATVDGMGGIEYTRRFVAGTGFSEWLCTSGVSSIVAFGTSGLWRWVKYSNGLAICKGATSNLQGKTLQTSGSLYSSGNVPLSLPFGLADSVIVGSANRSYPGVATPDYVTIEGNFRTSFNAALYGSQSGTTASDLIVRFLAVGFWK